MTRSPVTLADIDAITHEEIEAFLLEKLLNSDCSLCGGKIWKFDSLSSFGVDQNQRANYINLYPSCKTTSEMLAAIAFQLPVYNLMCQNCGHINLMSTEIVARWKHSKT